MADRETREMLELFGEFVCGHWQDGDSGIWEIRGERKRYTHSLALSWTCLNRLLALHDIGGLPGIRAALFRSHRDAIKARVEERCWNASLGCYVSVEGGSDVDASLLLLPYYGFLDASHARMRGTYEEIRRRLSAGPGLFYRNRHFQEGAFAVCSCWAADFLARGGGTLAEAVSVFEDFLGYANDVGLYGEEIDPASGRTLGNFPLAFTHLGLINAALAIDRRERGG
jgi:GH15 family glucan-1,4-alpha-glucosidase